MYKQLYFKDKALLKSAEELAKKNGLSLSKFTALLLQYAVDNQVTVKSVTSVIMEENDDHCTTCASWDDFANCPHCNPQ